MLEDYACRGTCKTKYKPKALLLKGSLELTPATQEAFEHKLIEELLDNLHRQHSRKQSHADLSEVYLSHIDEDSTSEQPELETFLIHLKHICIGLQRARPTAWNEFVNACLLSI
jgi:hypothetical protein